MNLVELDTALRKLHLSGMADVLEARLPSIAGTARVDSSRGGALPSCAARTEDCPTRSWMRCAGVSGYGGRLRLIALIEETSVVRRILNHLATVRA